MMTDRLADELFLGLRAFTRDSFPRRCPSCGREYDSAEVFIAETLAAGGSTGLKQTWDDDDTPMVELFRNCVCGSTLLELFEDRRDNSPAGQRRRQYFGRMLGLLEQRGLSIAVARRELLTIINGGHSEVLEQLGVRIQTH